MATVLATLKGGTLRFTGNQLEQWYGVSGTNTDITMLGGPLGTDATLANGTARGVRRLMMVTVQYSGAASTTVTVTLNYSNVTGAPGGGGTAGGYDVLLDSTALSAAQTYVFRPTGTVDLDVGDTITVLAPALASQVARVVITFETL